MHIAGGMGAGSAKRGIPSRSPEEAVRTGDGPQATVICGARMHNLKDLDCTIPLGAITVITGVSGSGKSTLAFDILYAEGQRRFVECLSAYARQFLERLERPEVESIGFIQPPVALKQQTSIKNARSTVGSITELTDQLRLLFTHAGITRCPRCGGRMMKTTTETVISAIEAAPPESRLAVSAPLSEKVLQNPEWLLSRGFTRLIQRGRVLELEPSSSAGGGLLQEGETFLVLDRLIAGRAPRSRMAEAIEAAWKEGEGRCTLWEIAQKDPTRVHEVRSFRRGFACVECGHRGQAPSPALFSWNSPLGACPKCQGFGRIITIDREKVVPDPRRTLRNDAVVAFSGPKARGWYRWMLREARRKGVPTGVPFRDLTEAQKDWVFQGDEDFPGVEGFFEELEHKRYKMHVRIFISRFRGYVTCPVCKGSRLKPEALATTVGGKNIHEIHSMTIDEATSFFGNLDLGETERAKVSPLLDEIRNRLKHLQAIGVGYLSLGRAARTLSGGETQRIRIAAALGSALSETLYILDEPTVGLHATDTHRMIRAMRELTARGNTVVVVEHDPLVIESANHLIVLGPGGGRYGGRVIYEGPPKDFLAENPGFFRLAASRSKEERNLDTRATGAAVERPRISAAVPNGVAGARKNAGATNRTIQPESRKKRKRLEHPWDEKAVAEWVAERRARARRRHPRLSASVPSIEIRGAREHNLKIESLRVPLGGLVAVTGISGSGKSTLIDSVLYRNWLRSVGRPAEDVGAVDEIRGFDQIEEVRFIEQGMPARSKRSNPISFVKAYQEIRNLFASTLAARQRRLGPGAFSFNTQGGRCEACGGLGTQVLEMYFLPDVEVTCEACGGKRFRPEVLEVKWQGKNIHDVLEMTVDEAIEFFSREPRVLEKLAPLKRVGLGYIVIGQSTSSLSGGEAQRLRLAAFLAEAGYTSSSRRKPSKGDLFLFDEPTTGLHARDIENLLGALRDLIAMGHSVVAVEHHLDFIASSDWVIDLGPGAGPDGGRVVYEGPPAGLTACEASATGAALRR